MTLKPPDGANVPDIAVPFDTRLDALESTSGALARKPPAARMMFADVEAGSDDNDGRSWGTAKKTIAAALAAMPNGGRVQIASSATEYPIAPLTNISKYMLEGVARVPGGTNSLPVLRQTGNGNMFEITLGRGGGIRHCLVYAATTAYTGAAVSAVSTATDITGDTLFENVIFSGGVGFERNLILDGSAHLTFGTRKHKFLNCQLFGARTTGESIVIKSGVHVHFIGGFQDQARVTDGGFGAVTQGIRVENVLSTDVQFMAFRMIGDFYSEAGGDVQYVGQITGAVTCAAGSDNNVFFGRVGSFTNSGLSGNIQIGPKSPIRLANYTIATQPTAASAKAGSVVYVSDAAAGAKFQGSDGASWVNLG